MTTEQLDDITHKIQKLLALAENAGTKGEAAAALAQAERLMLKYNIEQQQAANFKPPSDWISKYHGEGFRRYPAEMAYITPLLNDFFNVKVLIQYDCGLQYHTFFGRAHDVKIADHVATMLRAKYKALFKTWIREPNQTAYFVPAYGWGERFRKTYYAGIWKALHNRLADEREDFIQEDEQKETAIVAISTALTNAFKETFPDLEKSERQQLPNYHPTAYHDGIAAGEKISLHDALPSEGPSNLLE